MDIAAIEWLGVLVATIVVFTSGLVWFSPKGFFPAWWRAMGRSAEEQPAAGGSSMALVFGSTLVAIVAQVAMTALVIGLVDPAGDVTLGEGLAVGLVLGIVVAGAALGHRLFAGHGFRVWTLEIGNDVLNLVLAGAILSFWY